MQPYLLFHMSIPIRASIYVPVINPSLFFYFKVSGKDQYIFSLHASLLNCLLKIILHILIYSLLYKYIIVHSTSQYFLWRVYYVRGPGVVLMRKQIQFLNQGASCSHRAFETPSIAVVIIIISSSITILSQ